MASRLRFGAFLVPFHPVEDNPTLALERDLQLTRHLEDLNFDEVWYGEHHSGGYEIVASPEVMIASAAARTRRIRLGSAVNSLPYHQPLMLAERFSQLDHVTRGRAMLGMGPGSLASDARMMGIEIAKQRDMMDEGIDALVPLMRGETVTKKTDWFTLQNARIHMTPYSDPSVEMVVGSSVSPTGALAAGRHGLGLLSFGATSGAGFNALASNWKIAEDKAAEHGKTMDRSKWRLVGPMHIAATREQARAEVRFGIDKWVTYIREVASLPIAPGSGDIVEAMTSGHMAVIGTPDDAVAQLQRLQEQSGGFGSFLFLGTDWADKTETLRSFEMIARYVMPRVRYKPDNRQQSYEECRANRPEFIAKIGDAIQDRIQRHIQEKGEKDIAPELVAGLRDRTTKPPKT